MSEIANKLRMLRTDAMVAHYEKIGIEPIDKLRARMVSAMILELIIKKYSGDVVGPLVEQGFTIVEIKDHLPAAVAIVGELISRSKDFADAIEKREATGYRFNL